MKRRVIGVFVAVVMALAGTALVVSFVRFPQSYHDRANLWIGLFIHPSDNMELEDARY